MNDALEQFRIVHYVHLFTIGNHDIHISNMAVLLLSSFAAYATFAIVALKNATVIPGTIQTIFELLFHLPSKFLRSMVEDKDYYTNAGWIIATFFMMLTIDLMGNIPLVLSATSHICLNLTVASICMILITLYGLMKHKLHFVRVFAPSSVPLWALPVIVPVEVLTYLARAISLSVRLTANMVGGHIVLDVIAAISSRHFLVAIIGSPIVGALTGFEIIVSVLQAYIFSMLVSVYLSQVSSADH